MSQQTTGAKQGGIANLTNAGKGRTKGVPNKVTKQVKAMILEALDKAGGVDYLADRAKDQPAAFMTLVGKVLPLQIGGDPDGSPIQTLDVSKAPEEVLRWMAAQATGEPA